MSAEQSIRKKAQDGKLLIKDAIIELLKSYSDVWLRRSQIEEKLGLTSIYKGDSPQSSFADGGLASMLLSELCEADKKIRREKDNAGIWLYRSN
jgi:hypothetical protein